MFGILIAACLMPSPAWTVDADAEVSNKHAENVRKVEVAGKSITIDESKAVGGIKNIAIAPTLKLKESQQATTPRRANEKVGDAYATPFVLNFSESNQEEYITVYDLNEDLATWVYEYEEWNSTGKMSYNYGSYDPDPLVPANDYIVTVPIALKNDRNYIFRCDYDCSVIRKQEDIESAASFAIGEGDDYVNFTKITPTYDLDNKTIEYILQVPTNGNYRIAISAQGSLARGRFMVLNVSLSDNDVFSAPSAVKEFEVTAAEKGQLSATGSFVLPDTLINGEAITSFTKAEVYRDSLLIATIEEGLTASGKVTFVDNGEGMEHGFHTYKVLACNENGNGRATEQTIYVGVDTPLAPQNVEAYDNVDNIVITWEAPTGGVNGQYVDTESLSYMIETSSYDTIARDLTTYTYTHEMDMTGKQDIIQFSVMAASAAGISERTASYPVSLGDAYTLPFYESFPGMVPYNDQQWWAVSTNPYCNFYYNMDECVDDDEGCVHSYGWAGDEMELNSGKISLAGATNPAMFFSYYISPGLDYKLQVEIFNPDNRTSTVIGTIDSKERTEPDGWYKQVYSLNDFKECRYIILRFRTIFGEDEGNVFIDDINILDMKDNDLAVSMKADNKGIYGKPINAEVKVKNMGMNLAENYTVNLYVDDKIVDSVAGEPLATGFYQTYTLSFTPNATAPESVNMYAKIEYAEDMLADNNSSEVAVVSIPPRDFPTVEVYGELVEKVATLHWSAPDLSNMEPTLDDFESYEAWEYNEIGDWTLVDKDDERTYGFNDFVFPNMWENKAYMVFNPSSVDPNYMDYHEDLAPYSGEQYLACFGVDEWYAMMNYSNDDWLISPLLSGAEQIISFYAKSYAEGLNESIEILYSTTGKDTDDFVYLRSETSIPSEWTFFDAVVPEGTQYFAIRCVSSYCYALFLDDISFESATDNLVMAGYNVYRDRELVATLDEYTTTYADVDATDGDHVYNVSVLYTAGESSISNDVILETNDVDKVMINPVVYAANNKIEISNVAGNPVQVCNVNGVIVYSATGENNHTVAVEDGFYIVRIGTQNIKIMVK